MDAPRGAHIMSSKLTQASTSRRRAGDTLYRRYQYSIGPAHTFGKLGPKGDVLGSHFACPS